MPSFIKTDRDETLWAKAKEIAHKEYGKTEADGDDFYRIVTGIYKKMKGGAVKSFRFFPVLAKGLFLLLSKSQMSQLGLFGQEEVQKPGSLTSKTKKIVVL